MRGRLSPPPTPLPIQERVISLRASGQSIRVHMQTLARIAGGLDVGIVGDAGAAEPARSVGHAVHDEPMQPLGAQGTRLAGPPGPSAYRRRSSAGGSAPARAISRPSARRWGSLWAIRRSLCRAWNATRSPGRTRSPASRAPAVMGEEADHEALPQPGIVPALLLDHHVRHGGHQRPGEESGAGRDGVPAAVYTRTRSIPQLGDLLLSR